MSVLKSTSLLLKISGCYLPHSWTTPFERSLYNIYGVFSFLLLSSLVLSQILDVAINVESQDDFSDNFSVTAVVFLTWFKLSILLIRRGNFIFLIDTLQNKPFSPVDTEENEIRAKFEKITEWNTIGYWSLLLISTFFIYVRSLLIDFSNRKLMFRAWIPYDYSPAPIFILTFVHQAIAATICCTSSVTVDSLYTGLLINIYCQFEILEHRLRNVKTEQDDSVKQCAQHHDRIYQFSKKVNEEFKLILISQFCISMSVICFNLYRMTQIKMDTKFVEIILYSFCTITQIFYYCWYGNEVKDKSLQLPYMIFHSDWTSLNNNVTRALLIMMRRAVRPIEFTSIHVVSVNLESFMAVIKTSYSAFNMIQQSKQS
ncbi:PREDICTED: odorant receptor 94b-like [Habropoda laboriosa]|uniref:odorant receptor 94b-like n=1 Tax=Habropoda laboriosa TaxID=597456 RepID=UPI00083D8CCA|nr:PREDICTED: odorant receptor 94b-like [Habropoda laboriosa]